MPHGMRVRFGAGPAFPLRAACGFAIVALLAVCLPAAASDHADTPFLQAIGRHDARITGLHAFPHDGSLVLALETNPTIPVGATAYPFPADLVLEFLLDHHSVVLPVDPLGIGGTVAEPDHVRADLCFRVTFDEAGRPRLQRLPAGGPPEEIAAGGARLFVGLRDDPFIRGPRIGRNVAAVVLEVPLSEVLSDGTTLLIWAQSRIRGLEVPEGRIADAAGLPLRSQFPENQALNELSPRMQALKLGVVPDVLILDTARPVGYPNGFALEDDVVDLVGDPRVLENDAPFPSANDLPFLEEFPYLAEPHLP